MVANVTVSDKRGWSLYHYIGSSAKNRLHYFPSNKPMSKCLCGLRGLTTRTNIKNIFVDPRTYNPEKICKRCRLIVTDRNQTMKRLRELKV